jgi:hypothetical protein
MLVAHYDSKRHLQQSVGDYLDYEETSIFGDEYQSDGKFAVVGPSPQRRHWYASITMANGLIIEVT